MATMCESPMALPDRGHLETERRNPASAHLDSMGVEDMLTLINGQDMQVPLAVRAAIPALSRLVETAAAALRDGGRLIYVGAGTSGRLGVLDASECPPTFFVQPDRVVGIIAGGDAALRRSSEGAEDDPQGAADELNRLELNRRDVLVGIAAGGTTPYVWGALKLGRACGAATGLICCIKLNTAGLNMGLVDHAIELDVGPEVITGSTRMKAGTATKLALNMLTTATMVRLGKVWGNLMVDLRATNAKLVDRAARILMSQCGLDRDQAVGLLTRAQGRVKPALIMQQRGLTLDQAHELLNKHGGMLGPILGPPR